MRRHIRIWRWCITIQRGGQATPWPWIDVHLSRRTPRSPR